jgi:hypothetical protein
LRFRWQHFSTHSAAQVSHEQIQQSLPLRFLLTGHLVNKQLLRSLFEPTTGTHDTLHFLTNQRQLSSFNKLCWATDWDLSKREWCWMNFVVSRFRPHESVNSWQQSFVDNLSRWLFISFKILLKIFRESCSSFQSHRVIQDLQRSSDESDGAQKLSSDSQHLLSSLRGSS